MKRKITKTKITLTIDNDLYSEITELFYNRSEYVEQVIYNYLLNEKTEGIEKIIL